MGMSVSSNEAENLISQTDSFAEADEMQLASFIPSRLTLCIYHTLASMAIYVMSTSATAVLIFLLLFWYYGGVVLLFALLMAVLGKDYCSYRITLTTVVWLVQTLEIDFGKLVGLDQKINRPIFDLSS